MTIEQTVEIPTSRRLFVDVPPEVPAGKAVLTLTAISASDDLRYARKIWHSNSVHQEDMKGNLEKLRASLGQSAFGALDGVAYQHKVRKEWDG